MTTPLFIGVDGGGSRCAARLRDEAGRLLGEGAGGPANARLGERAIVEVMKACRAALTAAGLSEIDFARTHAGFGLAGTHQEEYRQKVLAHPHPFASLAVDTDAYTSWLGAFGGRDGAILILGTGAAGLAVIGGRRINVGGWGAEVADDGSGMAIGRLAIRRSLWALEGMAPITPLAAEILDAFDRDPEKVVAWAAAAKPADFASYAPLVFAHGDRRDPLAVAMLHETALDVERLVTRLLDHGAPSIAMIGGIFPQILPWLAPPLRPYLVEPKGDALDGAILMAKGAVAAPSVGAR